ncbi:ABC transporter substrate-binding protein [Methylobacterium aquaticum]|uniref:ABC transporter substrate-binding protein n=1 Tax=Methylobacterium aquaticum TaxID=270351 RepID=UPI003D182DA0
MEVLNRRSCLIGLALVTSLAASAAWGQSGKPVEIGVIFPLKNIIGKQGMQGASLAAEFIDADGGTVGRRPIKLIAYDTNFSPVEGVAAVQRLLTQDDVKVIVGEISSTIALAAIPIAKSEDALLMLAVPKHPDVTKSDYGGVFRLNTTTAMDAASFNKYLTQDVASNGIAVLVENNDVGRLSLDNMKSLFGAKLVYSDIFGVTQSDFSVIASNVRGSGADLVCVVASNPEQSGNLFKSMADLNYKPKRCLLPGFLNSDVPKVAGPAAEGVFSEDIYAPSIDTPLNKRFVDAYKVKYKETPSKVELLGFESVWIVAQAMKAAGTATDTKKIAETLRSNEWESPRGKLRFDGVGQAASDNLYRVEVRGGQVVQSAR